MSKKPTADSFVMPTEEECLANFSRNKHLLKEVCDLSANVVEQGGLLDFEFHSGGYLLVWTLHVQGHDEFRGDIWLFAKA